MNRNNEKWNTEIIVQHGYSIPFTDDRFDNEGKVYLYATMDSLLEGGADPNIQVDFEQKSTIMIHHYHERLRLLLEYGADPNLQDNYDDVCYCKVYN